MGIRTRVIQLLIDINERIIFYPKLKKFYTEKLKTDSITIMDVGSNKGQSIDFFLNLDSKASIYGFEPNRNLYLNLVKKYDHNKNIHLNNYGISNKASMLLFHENVLDETSSFEELNYDSAYLERKAKILGVEKKGLIKKSYEVKVKALGDFLAGKQNLFFDVLKIDVEGHEWQCLKGLFRKKNENYPIRFIQIESHNDDMYKNSNGDKVLGLLNENGFFEVARFKHGFGDFYEIIFENKKNK
ncbi:FkbM family methyltransferase [Aurantibacillus circumpalustris]|uniref:FkbM family methyltransferase n=1 Tax=Aurantibacillus circumpalustris TaxID=3036359 RepID=UPI00295C2595|nr:FkbM family methyltransferase [Aurantibacillus circumpalustris]